MLLLIIALVILIFAFGIAWGRSRRRKRQRQRLQQLRQWAGRERALEPAVQQWILHLGDDEAKVLLDLLNGYCSSLNWELNWLFAPQIKKAPTLQAALDESVGTYARDVLRSLQMEEDARAYQVYVAFEKKPTARKRRTLVHQLYLKINDKKLTPRTSRFFSRFASKEPSTKEQAAVIQQAFDRDPAHAMEALKEVLADDVTLTLQQVQSVPASVPAPVPVVTPT